MHTSKMEWCAAVIGSEECSGTITARRHRFGRVFGQDALLLNRNRRETPGRKILPMPRPSLIGLLLCGDLPGGISLRRVQRPRPKLPPGCLRDSRQSLRRHLPPEGAVRHSKFRTARRARAFPLEIFYHRCSSHFLRDLTEAIRVIA